MLTLYNKNYDVAKIEKTVDDLSKSYVIEEKRVTDSLDSYIIRRWSNGYVEAEGNVSTTVMTRDEHRALLYRIPVKVQRVDASVFSSQENCTSTYLLRPGYMSDKTATFVEYLRVMFYHYTSGAAAPESNQAYIRWQVSGFEVK